MATNLNEKQSRVLEWIRAGCPAGVYEKTYDHRIVARALERRGLVSLSGQGPTWKASLTPAGENTAAETPSPPLTGGAAEEPETTAGKLLAEVDKAGGRLPVPLEDGAEKTYRRLVGLSLSSPSRPRGKRLAMRKGGTYGNGPLELVFEDYFEDFVTAEPVPVPQRVAKYHSAVKAFLANKDWQYVTHEHVPRAARILQAIASAAGKRGYSIQGPNPVLSGSKDYVNPRISKAHMVLDTPAGKYELQIREIPAPGAKKLRPRAWNERRTLPHWEEKRGWEFTGTGKLDLVMNGPRTAYGGEHYRDSAATTVEDRLPQLFRSLEVHRLQNEAAEKHRLQAQAERRKQWETAMAAAREQYLEHKRWEHFTKRSNEWQAITGHRTFLAAAKEALAATENGHDAAREALEAAQDALNRRDPTVDPDLLVPVIDEPKPEDLKPFLTGWSPYGPDSRYR